MAQNPSGINTLYNVCSVYWGMFRTSGDIMSTSEDILSTLGNFMSTSVDFMSTLGGYHDACGGYHEYIEGCSVHWGFQYTLKGFCHLAPPHAS